MKYEVEHLENRMARLKVAVDETSLEKAKKQAARNLARRANIPGFRKGKAPYNVVARYFGEGAILEEAIEHLGPDLYKDALEAADLDPYGPGQLENIETEPELMLVFSLPLSPIVDLGDYRSLRLDYEEPEVTDEMVDDSLKYLLESRAVVEPKDGEAELGDQVKLLVYGVLLDDNGQAATTEDGGPFVLYEDESITFALNDEGNEPIPGFSQALLGIKADEDREFTLRFPADGEDAEPYIEEVRGKEARFQVECEEVATRYLPDLNDDFAAEITQGAVETLLELRLDVRNNLTDNVRQQRDAEYGEQVLNKLVEQATFDYAPVMVDDYIDDMVEGFKQRISQQGMSLEDYMTLNGMDEETLREDFREEAERRLKTALTLSEVVNQEQLEVDDSAVENEIYVRSQSLSGGNLELQKSLTRYLRSDENVRSITLNLLTDIAYQRLAAIAKGENPPIGVITEDESGDEAVAPGEAPETQQTPEAEVEPTIDENPS